MRSIDESFYKRADWIKCKDSYLVSVNYLCERCLAKGEVVPAKIVHHKIYLNEKNYQDPAIAYNFDNLEALCQDCHNKEHFGESTPRRFKVVDGKLIIL